ncbi:MAG: U32 family peptidase [archaeon]
MSKIEGRSRDPRYVDTAVKICRKALDKTLTQEKIKEGVEELKKVYNRGFSSGFYLRPPTTEDFAKIEHSAATEKKHFVGKITRYFPKVKVAGIQLVSELKVRDKIIIIGNTTGIIKSKVERLEINRIPINTAQKGQEVGLKLPPVKKDDEVYVIKS